MTPLPADHPCKGAGAVGVKDTLKLFRDFTDGLVPGNDFEAIISFFQRVGQAIGIVLKGGNVEAFPAHIPLTPRIVLVRADFDDPVILDLYFQPAIGSA